MTRTNSAQIGFLQTRGALPRVGLVLAALLVLIGAYYAAGWQFGRTMAETFSPAAETAAQTAALAVQLAPGDSQAYSAAGKSPRGRFFTEIQQNAEQDFIKAARYAPHDFRFWIELGRTREQLGDRAAGEQAMRRAVEVAPNFAYPRWMLGNLLLRDGRQDEAFAEFKRAAENHSVLRQQVFYLVWETTGGDAERLKQMFGDTPTVRAALAVFYAGKNLPEQSVQMWQTLTPEEKTDNRSAGENALKANFEKLNFAAAQVFVRDLEIETAAPEQITNAGFETDIGKPADSFFNWRVEPIKGLDVSLDLRQPHEGKRALRMTFSQFSEPTLQAAPQFVAVQPNAKYRLTFALRTNELKSAGMPVIEICEAKTMKVLGATPPFAAGSRDWQTIAVDFTTPPETKGVLLRTARSFCGAGCPIVGVVWYDDFKLERK